MLVLQKILAAGGYAGTSGIRRSPMTTPHLYCSHCGAVHQPQARMCNICGEPLGAFRSQDGIPGGAINVLPEGLVANHLLKQRYRILTQIGSGGYGDVYKAADTHIADRPVAIKEMRQHRLSDKEIASATAAFQREAFMLAKLTHPNLPSIY